MTDWYEELRSKACIILGVLLEDAVEYDCAEELYRKAGTLDPRSAAPHVRLGFLRWHVEEDVVGMHDAFGWGLRLGLRAIREALPKPEEARLVSLLLHPKQYSLPGTTRVPKDVEEWAERLERAEADLTAGRDQEAIDALEALLRANDEDPDPVPLLALAYMLLRASGGDRELTAGRESMLRKVQPQLARLLFPK